MPPKASYADRVFTTSVVGHPGMQHIEEGVDGAKDFSPVIQKALELGGYNEDKTFTGINGGSEVVTGFARNAVLGAADKVNDAIRSGDIKHIFLVGGCDGARPGRNYYTEFVKKAPKDTVILTLACGKYRFNDLDIGEIDGLPRIMDIGQCNDAYSAIQVALALADAFGCGVNDLRLTLVLSWYEQKAVCILLTLLALGVRNIYLGPTLPAFLSSNVLNVLVDNFDLKPISTPEEDLRTIIK
jgi:hydroxylamine reductase